MSNHITASVEFYYKGDKLSATIELDLDQHMQATGQLPELYPLLAKALNLDLYSYEYEMMQAEVIFFNNAKGLVAEHLDEGLLDIAAFETAWIENTLLEKLQEIAQRHLSIDDLQQQPDVKNALLEACQLGKDTVSQ